MGHSAQWEMSSQRIARLEEALADYAMRYGLTEKARLALAVSENPFADLITASQPEALSMARYPTQAALGTNSSAPDLAS